MIVGGSGAGKSAALARWLFRATDVEGFILPHFVGSTANSTKFEAIVTRLAEELKRSFGFESDVPTEWSELMEIVPKCPLEAHTVPLTVPLALSCAASAQCTQVLSRALCVCDRWLHLACATTPVIIVIDGLDQLIDICIYIYMYMYI